MAGLLPSQGMSAPGCMGGSSLLSFIQKSGFFSLMVLFRWECLESQTRMAMKQHAFHCKKIKNFPPPD